MRSLTAVLAAALVLLSAFPASAEPVNQPPVVVDDAVDLRNMAHGQWVMPLDNDSDPEGDQLTYTAVTPGTKGRTYVDSRVPSWLRYQPYLGTTAGTDSFTYTVSDGRGNTATGTVTVTLWDEIPSPSDFTIQHAGPDAVTLTWSAVPGASHYRIHRGGGESVTTTDLTLTDTGFHDQMHYSWSVGAVNGGGFESLAQPSVSRSYRLHTPRFLAVDVTADPRTLSLDWEGEDGGWNVYRDGALVASTTVSEFDDTGLVTGREYSYQVQHTWPSYPHVVYPPSHLSAPVTRAPVEHSPIGWRFLDLGGPTGELGPVTVAERAIPGGRQQDHRNGLILEQDGEAALAVMQPLATAYLSAGGAIGDLGFPVAEAECGLRDSGCGQFFEGGSVWDASSTPTVVVPQVIEDGWAASGWEEGPLGYPVADVVELPDGFGQEFEGGAVLWSAATGSHGVSGAIGELWVSAEGTDGRMGYPIGGEECGLIRDGCLQRFQGGSIYWSPASGAHLILGAIRNAWARQGWEHGGLGYPTTSEICGLRAGGCGQAFQGGSIHWSPATGAQVTTGAIRNAWARTGWENGRLVYPVTNEICGLRGGGCGQAFQGGSIHWSPATGAQVTTGAIRNAWARAGWENGALGYPTTGEMCGLRAFGCAQAFQGGSVHWSRGTGAQMTTGAVRDAWARSGWENGRLGYPVSGETFSGGAYRQTFQGGTITIPVKTWVAQISYR